MSQQYKESLIQQMLLEMQGRIDALRDALSYAQTRLEKVNGTFEYMVDELLPEGVDDGRTHAPPEEPLDSA